MYLPSVPLSSLPSLLLSEKDMVGWCYRGCRERETRGETGKQGWMLNWCVCVGVWTPFLSLNQQRGTEWVNTKQLNVEMLILWYVLCSVPAVCYIMLVYLCFDRNLSSVVSAVSQLLQFICCQQQTGVVTCPFLIRWNFARVVDWLPVLVAWLPVLVAE